jgi:hypothetical protein
MFATSCPRGRKQVLLTAGEEKGVAAMAKRLLAMIVLALAVVLGLVGSAMATHCYVADKPAGAGTNGAFMSEDGVDVFQWDLPEPAHENGSPTHGILELEE